MSQTTTTADPRRLGGIGNDVLNLTKEAALAELWGVDRLWMAERRRRDGWPHVRLTRFDIAYTDAQIAEIIDRYTVVGEEQSPAPASLLIEGQTARSASRRRKTA